jgi:uncharacterized protein DUF5946
VSDADTATSGPLTGEALETALCPGCGAVLAVVPGLVGTHPGASPSCAGLFGVTVRGLRDEAGQDIRTAALLQLATDAYDAQHLRDDEPPGPAVRLCLWLERNADPLLAAPLAGRAADAAPAAADPAGPVDDDGGRPRRRSGRRRPADAGRLLGRCGVDRLGTGAPRTAGSRRHRADRLIHVFAA